MKRHLLSIVSAVIVATPIAFAGGHLPLEVADQDAGISVTIALVNMEAGGFVTVHGSDEEGNMIVPASLGHTYVKAGKHHNVIVNLATAVAGGSALYAMLHQDSGQNKIYEFGVDTTEFDPPYIHDGAPVVSSFKVN